MLKVSFCSILLIILISRDCIAQQPVVFDGQPDLKNPINIAAQTQFYDDISGDTLAFATIKKQRFTPLTSSLMRVNAAAHPLIVNWMKLRIQNASIKDTLKLVFMCNAQVFIQLYSDDQAYSKPFSFEQINSDPTGMLLIIPPAKTNTYFVRIINFVHKLQPLNAELFTPITYLQNYQRNSVNQASLFMMMCAALGCLFFMGIYAGYSLLLNGDRALAYYTVYVFTAFYAWLATINTRFNLGLFGRPSWGAGLPLTSIAIFFYAMFIVYILSIPKNSPKKWRVVMFLLGFCIVEIMIDLIENYLGRFLFSSDIYYRYLLNIPKVAINLYLIYLLIVDRGPLKKYLLAGLLSLFFFAIVMNNVAYYISIRADSPKLKTFANFPPSWAMLGVVAEAICFAFALVYRGKLSQNEKKQLLANYAAQLEHELNERSLALQEQSNLLESQKLRQMEIIFEKKLAETEMAALRAQMNPHFIFNCLNSIKLYTLENDSETASAYLTTFSRLIRLVLENSRSEKVTVANELETLRLYIELEMMRFKNKVNYQINVGEDIDIGYIEIPPLLLQPYVENAIWHGLMHKEFGGTITINILQIEEHLLMLEIIDNGIGREMANNYKTKSTIKHKSFGLKMTAERIQIINQLYDMQTEIIVTDLCDEDGKACGTKVTIHVPI